MRAAAGPIWTAQLRTGAAPQGEREVTAALSAEGEEHALRLALRSGGSELAAPRHEGEAQFEFPAFAGSASLSAWWMPEQSFASQGGARAGWTWSESGGSAGLAVEHRAGTYRACADCPPAAPSATGLSTELARRWGELSLSLGGELWSTDLGASPAGAPAAIAGRPRAGFRGISPRIDGWTRLGLATQSWSSRWATSLEVRKTGTWGGALSAQLSAPARSTPALEQALAAEGHKSAGRFTLRAGGSAAHLSPDDQWRWSAWIGVDVTLAQSKPSASGP